VTASVLPGDDTVAFCFEVVPWWIRRLGGSAYVRAECPTRFPLEEDFPVPAQASPLERAGLFLKLVQKHTGTTGLPFVVDVRKEGSAAATLAGVPHGLTDVPQELPPGTFEVPEGLFDDEERPAQQERGGRNERRVWEGQPAQADQSAQPEPQQPQQPSDQPAPSGRAAVYEPDSAAPIRIPVVASDLDDAVVLVAQLATAVARHLAQKTPEPCPWRDEEALFAHEIGAVVLGFGVFLANAALRFHSSEEGVLIGWGYSRSTGFTAFELGYLLAMIEPLHETPEPLLRRHLSANAASAYKKAHRVLRKHHEEALAQLLAISAPHTNGPYR